METFETVEEYQARLKAWIEEHAKKKMDGIINGTSRPVDVLQYPQ